MTSKAGQQIVTRHILPNISIGKGNEAIFFFKNYAEQGD